MIEEKRADLEFYFEKFRKNTVGIDMEIETPFGNKPLVYADWIASGRLYAPIERIMREQIGPRVGNTHSESSYTGRYMTRTYHEAHEILKKHVNATEEDVIITSGSGMTGVLIKFQRILGLKLPEIHRDRLELKEEDRPVVFVTHMEHHSNQTSWLETIADVVVVEPGENLLVDPSNLVKELEKYHDRELKIGSFTACSNVTGIETPYYELAEIMHEHGGLCFVDFAGSAPYAEIDMHPEKEDRWLDAVFFSPHKFLGGPGSSGVLVFNKSLYGNHVPDNPGGGTVTWTNPWGGRSYYDDIETREDGGTPGFLQAIRAALAVRLKEKMTVEKIREREKKLLTRCYKAFDEMPRLHLLAGETRERLGVCSFYIDGLHHNLVVKLLNDRYGIQVRGGCFCAGTYGHHLLHVSKEQSQKITSLIDRGDLSQKPGWVRLSLHPTMTDEELDYILNALEKVINHAEAWSKEYTYTSSSNEFYHKKEEMGQAGLADMI